MLQRKRMRWWQAGLAVALSGLALASPWSARPARADADALWNKVVQVCVKSDPATDKANPCDVVNHAGDYVLVKDICGPTQYLLLPIRRLTGIESDALIPTPNNRVPNYFAAAWQNRGPVATRAGRDLAPEDYALALNSIDRRSQNQLHIHIDLARPDLRAALLPYQHDPVGSWSLFRYQGHDYHLTRLTDLARQNPVEIVRARVTAAMGVMRHQSIGLVGATFDDKTTGFYLLNSEFDGTPDGSGWAEELEIDHPRDDCKYRRSPAP
ncbi:MAG TPA: CDP-diacylglycerol diphosphatase [Terriglobia bacterium]|nr:CDP-diacylglycerol diphosphatase [Terriglobia bacterium]